MKGKIYVTGAFGDPRDRKYWSGTPANIIDALENDGWQVEGWGHEPPAWLKLLMKTRSFIAGQGTDFRRGEWARQRSTSVIESLAIDAQCRNVLHMGSLGIPLEAGSKLRHFIYLDSTYSLLASHRDAGPFNPRFEELENAALHRAECVFTVSEHVRNTVIQHYGVPAHRVICSGTGRGEISPLQGPKMANSHQILFVGKTRFGQKGGYLLLEGFRLARQVRPELRLTMVAPEENRTLIEGCPGTQFRTKVSWNELQTLFQTAALYAMPAPYEPWGLVYLEALASKCALLGMNRNALPEITQNGRFGILIDEATPSAVSTALLEAFREPRRLAEMGEKGQEFCLSRYSWQRTASIIGARLEAGA